MDQLDINAAGGRLWAAKVAYDRRSAACQLLYETLSLATGLMTQEMLDVILCLENSIARQDFSVHNLNSMPEALKRAGFELPEEWR